jgi:hypothetical protein
MRRELCLRTAGGHDHAWPGWLPDWDEAIAALTSRWQSSLRIHFYHEAARIMHVITITLAAAASTIITHQRSPFVIAHLLLLLLLLRRRGGAAAAAAAT